jgi:anti-anti-sigma factor
MITQRVLGDYTVLSLKGEINLYMAGELRRDIQSALQSDTVRKVAIDCSELQHIDSSGLGLLVHLHRTYAGPDGKGFLLLSLSPALETILRKAALDTYFKTATEKDLAFAG